VDIAVIGGKCLERKGLITNNLCIYWCRY